MNSNNLQRFIKNTENHAQARRNETQNVITEGEFFRHKYLELIDILNNKNIKSTQEDWEERERERATRVKNDALEDENEARKSLRWVILWIIVFWLIFVGGIILLQGFHVNIHFNKNHLYFDLPVSIINTLLGTTSLSVFGLYKVVVNYFFNKQ